ncbi:MAG: hypothetical protein A3F54_05460 [Candidatus Kerfeldbacteria bacterium RIFCSPHIGHO2_12_FULL_48_17]|uniref:Uncharacterized protein n=1 Tax=Candidatus Kerfeldbacteria bacterium RIFCSPHIGHO2_12_FULL_48_17 TaxID=1798542 RepID=A0A1G2B747_9BACT|nr:MAG: hypothetical protein A3F54_05460 [Candidatus Kerfeldbacteria bacterium RIFCSPHIGHO2_12_FULL_48_17]
MTVPISPIIEQFIDQILKESQLDMLDPKFLAEYKVALAEEIEKRIGIETMKMLNNDQLARLDQMLTDKAGLNAEKVTQFFSKEIPEYDKKIATKMLEFKTLFINRAKTQREAAVPKK